MCKIPTKFWMAEGVKIVIIYIFLLLRVGGKVPRKSGISQLKPHFLLPRPAKCMFSSSYRICSQAAERSQPQLLETVCPGPRVKLNEASWQPILTPVWTALSCQNGSSAYFFWKFISLRFSQFVQICWSEKCLEKIRRNVWTLPVLNFVST